jgi:hypothetical protein
MVGSAPTPDEFVQLPYFGWDRRPDDLPLDADECATALFLAHGEVYAAAAMLKAPPRRLRQAIRKNANLQRLIVRLGG